MKAGVHRHLVVLYVLALFGFVPLEVSAACPGCCSGHGGISASCSSVGRIVCVDGTVSPSCLCSTCGVAPPPPPPPPPPPSAQPSLQVVEYYSINTDSYFLTGRANEKELLDSFPALFSRTGMELTAVAAPTITPGSLAICRYFYKDAGINSTHFYGAGADCPLLSATAKTNSSFHDEGFDFVVGSVVSGTIIPGTCSGSAPYRVYRSFRAGTAAKTSNHRYTVSVASYNAINAQGYVGEGGQYCTTGAVDHRAVTESQ